MAKVQIVGLPEPEDTIKNVGIHLSDGIGGHKEMIVPQSILLSALSKQTIEIEDAKSFLDFIEQES